MLGEAGARISEGIPADLLKLKRENLEEQEEVARLLTGVLLGGADKPDKSDKSVEDLEEKRRADV
jgi:hypothetical protein